MVKPAHRTYSRQNLEALELLAQMIRVGRLDRKMRAQEMADRAGISRPLLRRIESADPRCAIGSVFEVAAIAGVPLFGGEPDRLQAQRSALTEKLTSCPRELASRGGLSTMTSKDGYKEAFVWIWPPGETKPVVAGVLQRVGAQFLFNYGRSYLTRKNAISIYEPELPLQAGEIPLSHDLSMPGSIRDASPDTWGRRVLINRKLSIKGTEAGSHDLGELTYLLESGSDRAGALDFQTSASIKPPPLSMCREEWTRPPWTTCCAQRSR